MTREELEDFVKEKSGGVVLYSLLWIAIKLGIRYGFEKAKEMSLTVDLESDYVYESAEQVIEELDNGNS